MSLDTTGSSNLCLLPREILQNVLSSYCDCQTLDSAWQAFSSNRRHGDNIWILLNQVLDERMARRPSSDNDGFDTIAASPPCDLGPSHRTRVFRQRTTMLKYCENHLGILWCGHMEFTDPLLPDGRPQTAKVVLRCDQSCWNWEYAVAWNRCYPSTIKLASQLYNFVPIRPRGQIVGVTLEDQAILDNVSQELKARDQVMTKRFVHSNGFILRIISPSQACHRLARFGWNSWKDIETVSSALICSWECPMLSDEHGDPISTTDKYAVIHRIVRALDDS